MSSAPSAVPLPVLRSGPETGRQAMNIAKRPTASRRLIIVARCCALRSSCVTFDRNWNSRFPSCLNSAQLHRRHAKQRDVADGLDRVHVAVSARPKMSWLKRSALTRVCRSAVPVALHAAVADREHQSADDPRRITIRAGRRIRTPISAGCSRSALLSGRTSAPRGRERNRPQRRRARRRKAQAQILQWLDAVDPFRQDLLSSCRLRTCRRTRSLVSVVVSR